MKVNILRDLDVSEGPQLLPLGRSFLIVLLIILINDNDNGWYISDPN